MAADTGILPLLLETGVPSGAEIRLSCVQRITLTKRYKADSAVLECRITWSTIEP